MPDAKFITLSKLDVAKRQLEHAIKLYFRSGDSVVIHTLVAAAYQILRDLGKKQGIRSILHDEAMLLVKPERRDELKKGFAEAENYFKHADRDSEISLNFYYLSTQYNIWDACLIYKRLCQEKVPLFILYEFWFNIDHSDLMIRENDKRTLENVKKFFDPNNKSKFLKLLPMIEDELIK